MARDATPGPSPLGWLLVVFAATVCGGGLLYLLVVLLGVWVLWGFVVLAGVFLIGVLHYLTWGRAMTRDVELERQRAADRDEEPEEGITTGIRRQESGIRRQGSGIRSQESGIGGRE